jgi:hypothetical protein
VAQPVSSDALPHVRASASRPWSWSSGRPFAAASSRRVRHGVRVSGVIRSQLQGQPPIVYRAGESFFEPPGVVHLLAENMNATEPARILAVFVADEGATLTTYH